MGTFFTPTKEQQRSNIGACLSLAQEIGPRGSEVGALFSKSKVLSSNPLRLDVQIYLESNIDEMLHFKLLNARGWTLNPNDPPTIDLVPLKVT